MFCAALMFVAAKPALAPYNYVGKLTDFMPEGSTWGMPASGQAVQIVISDKGSKVGPDSFSIKGPKWASSANLEFHGLTYTNGTLSGTIHFKNTSGCSLDAVRFDVVSATEKYKGPSSDLTRTLDAKEESPILLGDMVKDAEFAGADFKTSGLAWKPETEEIVVTAKLSGLTYQRNLFGDHAGAFVDMDTKGRLLVGSGQAEGVFRCNNLDSANIEMVTSTPACKVWVASNPVDGTLITTCMNSHSFTLFTPGGDQKSTIDECETEGMNSWPGEGRYDSKGNLYLSFGTAVGQYAGGKPTFVLKQCGQFEFGGDIQFDVAADGSLFIATQKNIFKFDPGGKNGKTFLKGPDEKLGRIHDCTAIRVAPNGYVWVGEPAYDAFNSRVSVFDPNGKIVWVFGRGGEQAPEEGFLDGQITHTPVSIACSGDGRVYVSCDEAARSVLEFYQF